MLKASAGGGGKGMRFVTDESHMKNDFVAAGSEALHSFGDSSLYLEKMIDPRHIEIQISPTATETLSTSENESVPSSAATRSCWKRVPVQSLTRRCAGRWVKPQSDRPCRPVRKRRHCGILLDKDLTFYFLEMNARLQVEHAITEAVTGVDLVCEQLRVLPANPFYQAGPGTMRGSAMECRIYAEDPERGHFLGGVIRRIQEPQGPGILTRFGNLSRVEVSIHYDPLLAKLIAFGANRPQTIARMRRALQEYRITGSRRIFHSFSCSFPNEDFLAVAAIPDWQKACRCMGKAENRVRSLSSRMPLQRPSHTPI